MRFIMSILILGSILTFSSCDELMETKTTDKIEYYSDGVKRLHKVYDKESKTYSGPMKMWHKNGKLALKGVLKLNERQGKFTYYDKEGDINCLAYYDEGNKVGEWIYLKKEDTIKRAIFKNGEMMKELKKGVDF